MNHENSLPYISGLFASILTYLILRVRYARKQVQQLPPGPKPYPLIGNLLDFPLSEEWITWQSYVERYGDLVFLSTLGRNFLLLGSQNVLSELVEKRISFNDRPKSAMLYDLMGFEWVLAFMPYGEHWRRGRKLMHAHTHSGVVTQYQPTLLLGARRFVRDLLTSEHSRAADRLSPEAMAVLPHIVRINFGLTAARLIYGINIQDHAAEAKYVGIPEAVQQAINEAAVPGRFLVDFIPLLKCIPAWFPFAHFRRFADITKSLHQEMRENPIIVTKSQIAEGNAPISIVSRMLESNPDDEQLVKDLAGAAYMAGSDTTVATVMSYFLAAVKYPDFQKQAQAELDRVVGRGRLPEFSDKANLPYLDAVMRECLRWLPVLPTGVAHSTSDDSEFRGYHIPKGTVILPFQWGLLHDPDHYPDPSSFSPERHLKRLPDGTWMLRDDVPDPRLFAFGFGRRICPGLHIAEQSVFSILATVLHTLHVTPAKDQDGVTILPEARVSSGLLSYALPFPYELHMREDADEMMEMCATAADEQGRPVECDT